MADADDQREELPDMRVVELAEGVSLVVRAMTGDDVDGLLDLYGGLDLDDRFRRFLSAFRPDRPFVDRLVAVTERGGCGLVAVVDRGDSRQIVAEASYDMLDNGDGELGITVADEWRGWLGPYLLDALLETAHSRGIPNLEADILATNGPMLALARSRGSVVSLNQDWSLVRVLIPTAGRTPSWPPRPEATRVLVEGPNGRWREAARPGVLVIACPGPGAGGRMCPALRGEPCPLAAGADMIAVTAPEHDELLRAHRSLHPGVPVCVQISPGDAATVEPGVEVIDRTTELAALVDRVSRG